MYNALGEQLHRISLEFSVEDVASGIFENEDAVEFMHAFMPPKESDFREPPRDRLQFAIEDDEIDRSLSPSDRRSRSKLLEEPASQLRKAVLERLQLRGVQKKISAENEEFSRLVMSQRRSMFRELIEEDAKVAMLSPFEMVDLIDEETIQDETTVPALADLHNRFANTLDVGIGNMARFQGVQANLMGFSGVLNSNRRIGSPRDAVNPTVAPML